jgi:hypothetical protein
MTDVVTLFSKACIYNKETNKTIVYGQSTAIVKKIHIAPSLNFELVAFNHTTGVDFFIKIDNQVSCLEAIDLYLNNEQKISFSSLQLYFPFENYSLILDEHSAIISTMCKNYSHRLDEWIQYNLKLGFSGIVIFDNDANKINNINEPTENCNNKLPIRQVCEKYSGKVLVVDFPYSHHINELTSWTNIQRMSLHIGVNALMKKCRNIALIDADEFICTPTSPHINIQQFLKDYATSINMYSNVLTNKNDNDFLDNNILELAEYIGEGLYTKTILYTEHIKEGEFIITPHFHNLGEYVHSDLIMHYHCFMNTRYKYSDTMKKLEYFKKYTLERSESARHRT